MTYWHKKDGGSLEFNWGNAFGNSYTCNVCFKTFILPTESQLIMRPHLIKELEKELIIK